MTKTVVIYTDGACSHNPGPGGWAYLLRYGAHEKLASGHEAETTNNRMELRAVIEALKSLTRPCAVAVYTDSQYVRKGILEWMEGWQRNGWRTAAKKAVKNQDLWQDLLAATALHEIDWHWVKGHSGDPDNERVDEAARLACKDKSS